MQNTDTHSKVHKIESNTKRKIYLTKKKQKNTRYRLPCFRIKQSKNIEKVKTSPEIGKRHPQSTHKKLTDSEKCQYKLFLKMILGNPTNNETLNIA